MRPIEQFRRCTLDGRASPNSALIADRLINEPGAVVSELKPLLDGPVGINSNPLERTADCAPLQEAFRSARSMLPSRIVNSALALHHPFSIWRLPLQISLHTTARGGAPIAGRRAQFAKMEGTRAGSKEWQILSWSYPRASSPTPSVHVESEQHLKMGSPSEGDLAAMSVLPGARSR